MEDAPRGLRESLKRVAVTLKEAGIPFALGGSYACWARGGPEPVHDVDFMVRQDDVPRAVEVLVEAGLRPVDPPEDWLTKVFDGEVLVDLIHHPVGREVTRQMLDRSSEMSVDSVRMPVLDATDWFEMTLLALEERYCDLARVIPMIRAMREQVDWDQVRRSTAASPFAEAALLVATRLNLIPAAGGPASPGRTCETEPADRPVVPAGKKKVPPVGAPPTGDAARGARPATKAGAAPGGVASAVPVPSTDVPGTDVPSTEVPGTEVPSTDVPATKVPSVGVTPVGATSNGVPSIGVTAPVTGLAEPVALDPAEADEYLAGDLSERLAEDPRVAELGLEVVVDGRRIVVEGEVATEAHRRAIVEVLAEALPGRLVRNEVTSVEWGPAPQPPTTVETIS